MGFFEGIEEITKPDTNGASVIEDEAAMVENLLPEDETPVEAPASGIKIHMYGTPAIIFIPHFL